MPLNRRSILKALAVAPAMLLRPSLSMASFEAADENFVYIYFIGLFLMEFQDKKLIVVTPKYRHHQFCVLDSDDHVTPMPKRVNLLDVLSQGTQDKFEPENLKFPATAVNSSGGYLLDPAHADQHRHRCTMTLPIPYEIKVGRTEPVSNFHSKYGNLEYYIRNGATGGRLGSMTRLKYAVKEKKKLSNLAYFALHHPLSLATVNAALRSARHVCGQGFDLQMCEIPRNMGSGNLSCPKWRELEEAFDLKVSDQKPSETTRTAGVHVDVASCPQFGITG